MSEVNVTKTNSAVAFVFAAFVLAVIGLVFAFDSPPLLDYPNHVARIWLISGGIAKPPFSDIYALDWSQARTNIGIDILASLFGPTLGAALLAKLVLVLAVVLPPLGALLLQRVAFGSLHPWQIAFLYFAWCSTLIGGFINFQIGLGLALLFAVADHLLQRRGLLLVVPWRVVAALILALDHPFAVGFYILLVLAMEFGEDFRVFGSGAAFRHFVLRALALVVPCLLTVVILLKSGTSLPGASNEHAGTVWNDSIISQFGNLLSALWTYKLEADAVFLFPVLVVGLTAVFGRAVRVHAGLAIAAGLLLAFSIASPRHIFATGYISWRFPIMAVLALLAGTRPFPDLSGRKSLALAGLLALTVLGRTAWIGDLWSLGNRDALDVKSVLSSVPAGAVILPLQNNPDSSARQASPPQRYSNAGLSTFQHLATLAVPYRHAFVPTVFSAKGKQPLTVLPPWSEIAVAEGNVASPNALYCRVIWETITDAGGYVGAWRTRFDYVLLLNADVADQFGPFTPDAQLQLVASSPFALLYKVLKPDGKADHGDLCPAETKVKIADFLRENS